MSRSFIVPILLFTILASLASTVPLEDCSALIINNDLRYDVCAFNNRKTPFQFAYDNRPTEYYNVSMGLTKNDVPTCADPNKTIFATIKDLLKDETCYNLAVKGPDVDLIDPTDDNSGLVFTYPAVTGADDSFGKALIVRVTCDLSAPTGSATQFKVKDITETSVNVVGVSSSACPTSHLSKFIAFLQENKNIFSIVFLIIGFVICFFGIQVFNAAIFVIATVAGTCLTGILFFFFTDYSTKGWVLWLVFGICLCIGLVLGVLSLKLEPLGFLVLGIVLGVVAGSFLYNAAIAPFFKGSSVALYLTESLTALVGAVIAYKLWKDIIMISTAYIGAYMICKSIAVYIGGFPTEDSIADGIENWSPETYIYLALIVVLTILGGVTQYRKQRAEELNNQESDRYARVINGPDVSV